MILISTDSKRLIGRSFSDSKVQEDIKLWPFKFIEGPPDTPKIVVTYKGQEKEFLAEEISSMILGKMKGIAEAYLGKVVKDAVIICPCLLQRFTTSGYQGCRYYCWIKRHSYDQ